MHNDAPYQLGWGAGWSAAVEKMRVLISAELSDLEARLRLNLEDGFDEGDPPVFYLQRQITSLRKLAGDMDIFLPAGEIGGGTEDGTL